MHTKNVRVAWGQHTIPGFHTAHNEDAFQSLAQRAGIDDLLATFSAALIAQVWKHSTSTLLALVSFTRRLDCPSVDLEHLRNSAGVTLDQDALVAAFEELGSHSNRFSSLRFFLHGVSASLSALEMVSSQDDKASRRHLLVTVELFNDWPLGLQLGTASISFRKPCKQSHLQ